MPRSRTSTGCAVVPRQVQIVDGDLLLLGIVANRDLRFVPVAEWATTKVDEVMTPSPLVTGPIGITATRQQPCCGSTRENGCHSSTMPGRFVVERFPHASKHRRNLSWWRCHRLLRRCLAAGNHACRRGGQMWSTTHGHVRMLRW